MSRKHLQAAVDLLRKDLTDDSKEREVVFFRGDLYLIDETGGAILALCDDVTAVHYFLKWVDSIRRVVEIDARRGAMADVKSRPHSEAVLPDWRSAP